MTKITAVIKDILSLSSMEPKTLRKRLNSLSVQSLLVTPIMV